jgi:hypothetical protein
MSASIVDNIRRSGKGVAGRGLDSGAAISAAGQAERLHHESPRRIGPIDRLAAGPDNQERIEDHFP